MPIHSETGHPYDTDLPSAVRRGYCDGRYGQLHFHYRDQVSSPSIPTVFLHMSSKNGRQWRQVMGHWPGNGLLLAPDYPGYGESDPPPLAPLVTIDDYADEVIRLLDHFQLQEVDLVGIHTGSLVGVALAAKVPERVRQLVQFSAPLFSDEELVGLRRDFEQPIPLDQEGSRFRVMWQRILTYGGPEMTLPWAAWSMRDNLLPGEAYEFGHRAAFDYVETYRTLLPSLSLRQWIVNPADDCQLISRRAAGLIQQGEILEFPQWQGSSFLDMRAAEVAATVYSLLDKQ